MAEPACEEQLEEIETLQAVYGEELIVNDQKSYGINVKVTEDLVIEFSWLYSDDFPNSTPTYKINAEWMSREHLDKVSEKLTDISNENEPQGTVYEWIEWLREELLDHLGETEESITPHYMRKSKPKKAPEAVMEPVQTENEEDSTEQPPHVETWVGQAVTDRKSRFLAHLAVVQSTDEVDSVMDDLLSDKRINAATHNMYAYRLRKKNQTIAEYRDDDGEHGGGDTILKTLQLRKELGVLVVVTRWYGGKKLGPDRFKHIQNVTKAVLDEHAERRSRVDSLPTTKERLTPAAEILSRIKWDTKFINFDWIVCYRDRFVGPTEVPYEEFMSQSDIPMHRVLYVKKDNEVVWDRKSRLDKMDQIC